MIFSSICDEDELEIVLSGFSENLRGTASVDASAGKQDLLLFLVNNMFFLHYHKASQLDNFFIIDQITVLESYGAALNEIIQERSATLIDRVKGEGVSFIENFLECNEEAIKTESGLVYCVMSEGAGSQPTLQNTVEVHYHGTLIDGTVFDSSVDRGQTISFPLNGVIKGWQEG